MARAGWNLHQPSVAGLEYVGVGTRSYLLQSQTDARITKFTAQQSGPVDSIQVYLGRNTNVPLTGTKWPNAGVPYAVELMTYASFLTAFTLQQNQNEAINLFNNVQVLSQDGSPAVDAAFQDPNDGLYLKRNATSGNHRTDLGLGDVILTGQQLLGWMFNGRHTGAPLQLSRMGDNNSGAAAATWIASSIGQGTWTQYVGEFWIETGLTGWQEFTPTKYRQFNSTVGNRRWRWQYTGTSTFFWDWFITWLAYIPERRLGMGILDPRLSFGSSQGDRWITVPIHTPAATGTPSLTAGTEYVIMIRPPYHLQEAYLASGLSSILDVRTIADRSGAHFTDLDWNTYPPDTWVGAPNTILQPPNDGVLALRNVNAGNPTNDSQPYEYTLGMQIGTGRNSRQIAVPASTSVQYGLVKAVVSASRSPGTNLNVDVRNATTQAFIASATLTEEQWEAANDVGTDDFGDRYREAFFDLGANFTLPATVDLLFYSSAATGSPWLLAACASAAVTGTDVTFGGSSSYVTGSATSPRDGLLTVIGPATALRGDAEAVVMVRPPTVTGSPPLVVTQDLLGGTCQICPQSGTACAVTGVPIVAISWTVSPVTGFGYYELQRSDGGGDFVTIAKLTPAATANGYLDQAVPFGVAAQWRVRVVQSTGATSLWSNIMSATIDPPHGAGLVITARNDTLLTVAYPDVHGDRLPAQSDWSFLDAQDTVLFPVYGRDGQLALRPTERRGVQFTRTMLLSAFCVATTCLTVADGLRALMNTTEPYLVVRDNRGCSWYMSVSIPGVTRLADPGVGDIWTADVTFTETPTPEVEVTVV